MATLISVLTNQFFLIFLAIALGLALGKIKIGKFSLGVSGGIFFWYRDWLHRSDLGKGCTGGRTWLLQCNECA